jgi:hypothetical protein
MGNGGGGEGGSILRKKNRNFYDRREQKYQQVALEVERKHLNVSESLSISKNVYQRAG